MLLKRLEKKGKIKGMYHSSTICGSIYDPATKELIMIFNNGGQYKYPNVESTDYTRFETADSHGAAFNTYIKKKYTIFEKLDKLDATAIAMILVEIKELKEAEDKSLTEGKSKALIESLYSLIGNYISTGTINADLFAKAKTKVTEYDNFLNPEPETAA